MGMSLVKAAIATQGRLPARQYKVLLRMCVSARDRPVGDFPEHVYTGGWEPLAMALGYDVDEAADSAWMRTEVSRICRDLSDKGLIKPLVDNPRAGTRQVWRIGDLLVR